MKKITTLSLLLFFCFIGLSQCPTEYIGLLSQEEVDNFSTNYPNCTELTHNIKVNGEFNSIDNLNGLSLITSAQDIYIINTDLSSFEGLHNLETIASLRLWANHNIQNLEGLSSLENAGNFEFFVNNNLSSLQGIDNLQSLNDISFFSNTNLEDISQLSFLTSLDQVTIGGNALTSLIGLQNLENVNDNLSISGEGIQNFDGLTNLQSIGGSLYLQNNPEIQNISAFDNIESLTDLYIVNLPNLENFWGLHNLKTVSGTLRIGFNPEITSLSFFKKIVSVGYLDIYENENLETLQGIESLQYIEERLFIDSNPNLTTVKALDYMEFPSGINEVAIINNISLQICDTDFICSILDDTNVSKGFFNNAEGCNTIEEVEDSCALTFLDLFSPIVIFPNPVSDSFTISMDENMKLINLQIYSALGVLIYETNKSNVSLNSFKSGIYSVKINTDKGVFDRKIIKE